MSDTHSGLARRSFLSRLGAGATAFGAAFAAAAPAGAAQAGRDAAPGGFQPARHAQDDWFDSVPGRHRLFFDTVSPEGLGEAIFFANNFFTGNKNGYGLEPTEVAVVICVRHSSTSFAFGDAMWSKYGEGLAERAKSFTDPKTKAVPTVNVYRASGYGPALPNMGVTIDAIAKNGVQFAVCQMATRACAAAAARKTGGKVDDVYAELTANLIPNAHLVPAGIVAVNRAQERGYSFTYGG
jgi:intracellular sulfur oxidation DsrE/DsrF family protein